MEDKIAMESYLETMTQGTTLKQKAYGTLASSEMQAETIEQLVSLPWKAVVLRYFEEEMRTTPRIHTLIAVPYVRTKFQLRFARCMIGLTREEYDSEERKRSKEEKVFLMTSMRDLIIQEGMAVACAKRRDALCCILFMIEQISVPAEWTELNLAPMRMRGRAEIPEASLILTSVKQELTVGGTLQTRTFLVPFDYEEIKVVHGEEEDKSAGRLIIPKFPEGAKTERQGASNSRDTSG